MLKKSDIQFPSPSRRPLPQPSRMPLRQFEARGWRLYFARYGQRQWRHRRKSTAPDSRSESSTSMRRLDQPGDRAKSDLAGNEGGDCDLVGGIVDRGRAAAGPQRLIGQPQAPGSVKIRSLEGQLADLGKIELAPPARRSDPASPGNARSACACRARRVAPPRSDRKTRPCRG